MLCIRKFIMSANFSVNAAACVEDVVTHLPSKDDEDDEPPTKKIRRDPRPTPKSLCKPLEEPTFFVENDGSNSTGSDESEFQTNHCELQIEGKRYYYKYYPSVLEKIELKILKLPRKKLPSSDPPGSEAFEKIKPRVAVEHVRHELPVLNKPLTFIENNDDVVVVDKPCSLPVHPCGRYSYNCLTYWLEHDHGIKTLKLVHRLDRLTSGIVILSKTSAVDLKLKRELVEHKIKKEYLARVEGEFPEGEMICEQSLDTIIHSMGIQRVSSDKSAKVCKTKFQLVHFNGESSVVRCFPLTGRTHQIRVHLQYLGYPIVNDYVYNSLAWGSQKGKNAEYGMPLVDLVCGLQKALGAQNWIMDFDVSIQDFIDSKNVHLKPDNEKESNASIEPVVEKSEKLEEISKDLDAAIYAAYDPLCPDCHLKPREPTEKDLQMYLHCLKYEGPDWSYSTELPDWAKPEWKESNCG